MKPIAIVPVLLLSLVSAANGDTTFQITSGAVQVLAPLVESSGFGSLQFALFGPDLVFNGQGSTRAGPCTAYPAAGGGFCQAGSTQNSALASIGSEDGGAAGKIVLGTTNYYYQAAPGTNDTVSIDFQYTFTVPNTGAPVVSVKAPFTASALFASPVLFPQFGFIDMPGRGIVTIDLIAAPQFPGFYELQSARYNFTAVPEPSSMLLLVIGLVGSVSVIRRKRITSQ